MAPSDYQALFKLWRERELSLRVAYTIFAQGRGRELEDYQDLTELLPMGFGDATADEFINTNPNFAGGRGSASNF